MRSLLIIVICVGISDLASAQYTFVDKWGTPGTGSGQFDGSFGVGVDAVGDVYVVDTGNNRIQKFSAAGVYLTQWGSAGSGNGQFNNPSAVAFDSGGNVYVTDSLNSRVQVFTSAGVYVSQFAVPGWPVGIAIDASDNKYISDGLLFAVHGVNSANLGLFSWGGNGTGNGQFGGSFPTALGPAGVAVDNSGDVYVADTQNHRIQKFTTNGVYLGQWGVSGTGNGQFSSPFGIAIDAFDNVFVSDQGNARVQVFDIAGTYVAQFGTAGSNDGEFGFPRGLAIANDGEHVYVSDLTLDRVQMFSTPLLSSLPAAAFLGLVLTVSVLLLGAVYGIRRVTKVVSI